MCRRLLILLCLLGLTSLEASPYVIGIAGGTGSGKSTLTHRLKEAFGDKAVVIEQDCYYKDQSCLSYDERLNTNYDHPESIDFELLKAHIKLLKENEQISKPRYSFQTHTREIIREIVYPAPVVIIEGILLLAVPEVRDLLDLKIFVETEDDVRILRRLERDVAERGRDIEGIKVQYLETVKPMHTLFVAPSRDQADLIVPGVGEHQAVIKMIVSGSL